MPEGVPTYQRVAADGTVTNEFEGHIRADGLDLPSSPTFVGQDPTADSQVVWEDDRDGAKVASIYARKESVTAAHELIIQTDANPGQTGGKTAGVQLRARTPNAESQVIIGASDPGAGGDNSIHAYVAKPTLQFKKIIDGDGDSDFLQLASQANRKIAFGVSSVTFSGAAAALSPTLAHNLGGFPAGALAMAAVNSFGQQLIAMLYDWFTTYVRFQFSTSTGVAISGTWQFYWIAWR